MTMNKTKKQKNLEYYLSLPYTIELVPDEDGSWFAKVPLLEGCISTGNDAQDALEMILDAKHGWLLTALEIGIDIPEPESEADDTNKGAEVGFWDIKTNINARNKAGIAEADAKDIRLIPKPDRERVVEMDFSPQKTTGTLKQEAR